MAFYRNITQLGRMQRRIRKNRRRALPRLTKLPGSWYVGHYAPNPNPDGFAPPEYWANNQAFGSSYADERARRQEISRSKVRGRRRDRARRKQELLRDADVDRDGSL